VQKYFFTHSHKIFRDKLFNSQNFSPHIFKKLFSIVKNFHRIVRRKLLRFCANTK